MTEQQTAEDPRRIEWVPLDEIQEDPTNPKAHADELIDASIGRHGVIDLMTRDDRTGYLISGHGRLHTIRGRREAGAAPPPGVRQAVDGRWLVPVVVGWSSTDDLDAQAALVGLNQTTILGGWLDDALLSTLDRLRDADALDGVGFDGDRIEALRARLADPPQKLTDPDAVPEPPPGDPISRKGDLWQLGRHRLVVGDCTSAHVITQVGGDDADMVLTDPPYCSGGFTEAAKSSGAGSVGTTATHKPVANDRLSVRGYQALLKAALDGVPAAFAYVFTDWRMWTYLFDVMESTGRNVRNMIVWDKGTPGMGRGWRAQHEIVMWGAARTPPFDNHAQPLGNVLQSKRTGNVLHTTQKPVDLLVQILNTSPFGQTIYDPFAGSGSTLIACEETDRTALLVELDPAYADVICRRYQDYTGIKPTRDGERYDFTA